MAPLCLAFSASCASFSEQIKRTRLPVNRYEGFQADGAGVLRDRRGTVKAEIPQAIEMSLAGGDDPLAI